VVQDYRENGEVMSDRAEIAEEARRTIEANGPLESIVEAVDKLIHGAIACYSSEYMAMNITSYDPRQEVYFGAELLRQSLAALSRRLDMAALEDLKPQAQTWASELESNLPAPIPEGAEGAVGGAIGEIIGKTRELVDALKAGDWKKVAVLVRDLLTLLIGDDGQVAPAFQQSGVLGDGFKNLLKSVLLQLLEKVIFGAAAA
jgi:hypothetical protein